MQQFIAGIYNYCDRWCERCTFTSRCRNFDGTSKLSPEQLDINNKAFWDNISSGFTDAIALLHKAAKEHGINITSITKDEEDAYKKREAFIKSAAKNHALSKLCKQYQKIVQPFVKQSGNMADKTRQLVSELHMGLKSEDDVVHSIAGMGDCFEIIQWYVFFIDAKLQRALHGKLEEDDEDVQSDSNGSAKIAFIGIEKSMHAWMKLYELMPAAEDVALQALALLNQLKKSAMVEFPNLMQFKRPGFDDWVSI